jgi:hypothetical protein
MSNNPRLRVIELSIYIESIVSKILSGLLKIDMETSNTLGNRSSAFSFKQKLDLLMDIKFFDKSYLPKFMAFAEIRNQFAHNYDVNNFTTCFANLAGKENFLLKAYPRVELENRTNEEKLSVLYERLYADIIEILAEIIKAMSDKFIKIGMEQGGREVLQVVYDTIIDYARTNQDFRDNHFYIIQEAVKKFKQ